VERERRAAPFLPFKLRLLGARDLLRTKFKLSLDANLTLHKSSAAKLLKYLLEKKSSREGSPAKMPPLTVELVANCPRRMTSYPPSQAFACAPLSSD